MTLAVGFSGKIDCKTANLEVIENELPRNDSYHWFVVWLLQILVFVI